MLDLANGLVHFAETSHSRCGLLHSGIRGLDLNGFGRAPGPDCGRPNNHHRSDGAATVIVGRGIAALGPPRAGPAPLPVPGIQAGPARAGPAAAAGGNIMVLRKMHVY